MESFVVTPDLYASKGARFANYLIDTACRICVIVACVVLLHSNVIDDGFMPYVIDFTTCILYYIIIEGFTGTSIGKMITGTKVVLVDGSRPEFGTIVKRTLCRLIPFNAISGLLGSDGLFWHDSFSDTFVVNAKKLENQQIIHSGAIGASTQFNNY